jgi:hypothetical protein
MAMNEPTPSAETWAGLLPYERAAAWKRSSPELARELVEESKRQMRHTRRMDWARWVLQAGTVVLGYALGIVVGLSLVKAGHPWPGAGAFGLGSGAAAAGGYLSRRQAVTRGRTRR